METDDSILGASGSPSQLASEAPTQPSAIDYAKLAEALEPVIDRKLQSQKDSRIAKLTGRVDEFSKQLENYFAYAGGKVDQAALRQMQIDALLEQNQPTATAGSSTSAPGGAGIWA